MRRSGGDGAEWVQVFDWGEVNPGLRPLPPFIVRAVVVSLPRMPYPNAPTAALILGITSIIVFYRPIARLIDRIRNVKIAGHALDASAGSQDTAVQPKPSAADKLLEAFDNQLLLEQERAIEADLDTRGVKDVNERLEIVKKFLAATQIVGWFENTYRIIFGSQLNALQRLNSSTPTGLSKEQLKPFYDIAVTISPEYYENYTFENWLQFLASSLLITTAGPNIAITVRGREFLKYMVEMGHTLNKPG
jgi:hypothetical protein